MRVGAPGRIGTSASTIGRRMWRPVRTSGIGSSRVNGTAAARALRVNRPGSASSTAPPAAAQSRCRLLNRGPPEVVIVLLDDLDLALHPGMDGAQEVQRRPDRSDDRA